VLAFVFAGVALQIRSDPALASRWRLPPAYLRYTDTSEGARCFVHATCSLALDAGFPASAAPSGVAAWQRVHGHGERCDALSVRGDQYAFDVQAVRGQGAPRFEVAARVASALIVPELFLQLAVTLGELAGGLCLHATAVEYAAQAVLLLGPSGAGKSTAAGLLGPAARCLAHDRVLVTQLAGAGAAADGGRPGFEVWALPIGRPPALEPSTAMVLPLAGLLRIRQVDAAAQPDATSSVRRVRPAGAALYVRQAVESPVGSGFFEPERLMTVSELVLAAPSGIADIALGQPWSAALAQFLRFSAAAAADAVETGAHAAEPVVAHSPF
jgi:hypothetical protein